MTYELTNPIGNATTNSIHALSEAGSTPFTKRRIEILTTGKGGVGKTMVAGLIAQYRMECGEPVSCIDADPVNNTLAGVPAFNAQVIDLLTEDALNVSVMDELVSSVMETETNYIIDPGAAGYVPLISYLLRDGLFEFLAENGKRVVAHAVITGGEAHADTTASLIDLIERLPPCVEVIAWLNTFFGPLEHKGVPFEQTAFWQTRKRIHGVVRLAELPTTTLPTFRKLLNSRMTFAEATNSDFFNAVEKLRLSRIWAPLRAQIAVL